MVDNSNKCIFFKQIRAKKLNKGNIDASFTAAQSRQLVSQTEPIGFQSLKYIIKIAYDHSKQKLSTLSPTSRRRKLSSLKGFSKWCLEQELIDSDPMRSAPTTKLKELLPKYLNLDEILVYYESLRSDVENEPFKYQNELLCFLVFYGCGLRLDETCNIRSENIDLKNCRILIKGKGSTERFAILPDFVIRRLKALWTPTDNYLYGKKALVNRTVYNWVRKRGLKAGLHKPVHPHMFRHSFATHMLREKTDLRHLQELLGHSSLVATQRYTHLDKDQILQSLESFHPLSDSDIKK